ncbi:MAG TPA: VCBS repeat-containing protein, partial [Phycisphaerae bacterium]|nr:VCBS repeat-containing protein [Phycisphaerae bacterium]
MKGPKNFELLNASDKGKKVLLCVLIAVVFSWSPGFAQAGNFQNQTASLMPGYSGQWTKAAWGDYNNDGYPDLVSASALWRNNAGINFTRIEIQGYPDPVLWADIDNDGLLDFYDFGYRSGSIIYEPNGEAGVNVMYRNTSTPTTTSFQTVPMPSRPMGVSLGASFADFDNNGFIDIYAGGYEGGVQTDAVLFN